MYKQEALKIVERSWSQLSVQPAERSSIVRDVCRRRQCRSRDEVAESIEEWEVVA